MSEAVWLAIIGIVAMVVKHWLDMSIQRVVKEKIDENTAKTIEYSDKIEEVKIDVRKIEIATNSIKDDLVEATRVGATAIGELKGRADAHEEGVKMKAL